MENFVLVYRMYKDGMNELLASAKSSQNVSAWTPMTTIAIS